MKEQRGLKETLKNCGQLTLMFAPIHCSYSSSFEATEIGTVLSYELSDHVFPVTVTDSLAYLNEWQQVFDETA